MKKINPLYYIITLLVVIVIVLSLVLRDKSIKLEVAQNNISAITDTLRVDTIDGKERASILALQETNLKNLLKIKSSDSTIKELQRIIREHKNSTQVVYVEGESRIDTIIKTIVDTVDNYPVYSSRFNLNGWVEGNTLSTKDSTRINLSVRNKYDVIISKKGEATVINHNPYSTTKALRAATVQLPKPKRWGIGPSVGVYYFPNKGSISTGIGVGINYSLLSF